MIQLKFLHQSNLVPKDTDYPLFLFLTLVIPLTYWFEIWIVLPYMFSDIPEIYWSVFALGHFVLHNIIGNFIGVLLHDTSIRGRKMPTEGEPGALYCNICKTFTPARSYHCPACNICILKRDHHCSFTNCCIGFYNHRFFILLIFYLLISTSVCMPFNLYFLFQNVSLRELIFLPSILVPLALFIFDLGKDNLNVEHLYIVISGIGLMGVILCTVWFVFHMKLILHGKILYEMRKCTDIYNMGEIKNLKVVLGEKWYLTWLSPYIKSPLLGDGIRYKIGELGNGSCEKNTFDQIVSEKWDNNYKTD